MVVCREMKHAKVASSAEIFAIYPQKVVMYIHCTSTTFHFILIFICNRNKIHKDPPLLLKHYLYGVLVVAKSQCIYNNVTGLFFIVYREQP